MKTFVLVLVSIVAVIVLWGLFRFFYSKHINKTVAKTIHPGCYIFFTDFGLDGNLEFERTYSVCRVMKLAGDKVSVTYVRRFKQHEDQPFTLTRKEYNELLPIISDAIVTGIPVEELYENWRDGDFPTDKHLQRYPQLKSSPYYYEISADTLFGLTTQISLREMIEHNKFITYTNNGIREMLGGGIEESIDAIVCAKK